MVHTFWVGCGRGVLKIEEAVRGAFGGGSVFGGVSEEGKSVLVAHDRRTAVEAGSVSFVSLRGGGHEATSSPLSASGVAGMKPHSSPSCSAPRSRFVLLQYRSGIRASVSKESSSLAFTSKTRLTSSRRAARHEATFVSFVFSTTKQIRVASVSGWAPGGE